MIFVNITLEILSQHRTGQNALQGEMSANYALLQTMGHQNPYLRNKGKGNNHHHHHHRFCSKNEKLPSIMKFHFKN